MKILLYSLALWLSLSSCVKKVTLVVEELPENTPKSASIFVTGNFNYWDPSDRNFLLKPKENGKLMVDLPYGWGDANYKFTRGDWKTVEKDDCGQEMLNRVVNYFFQDTVRVQIQSWSDLGPTNCKRLVLITNVPPETPKGTCIFFASNQNNWDPGDSSSTLWPDELGRYITTVDKIEGLVEFKVTRGSWDSEELDENRRPIPNRKFMFGQDDTLFVNVAAWKDIVPGLESRSITILATTPFTTRENDSVFVCGTFNDWKPGDARYKMQRLAKNKFAITFTKPQGSMEFKLTRGSWPTQEVDQYHNTIANRSFTIRGDTMQVVVQGWQDRNPRGKK